MKICKPRFVWYDHWFGGYYDRARSIYYLAIPFFTIPIILKEQGKDAAEDTVAVDFDGVISDFRGCGGYKGPGIVEGFPVEGAAEGMHYLCLSHKKVVIYSTRAADPDGVKAIQEYCKKFRIEYTEISAVKPMALIYIDDRGLKFDGDWNQTLIDVENFETWIDKPKSN